MTRFVASRAYRNLRRAGRGDKVALNSQGIGVLAGLLVTIIIWIFKPFKLPFSMGGVFLAMSLLVIGLKPAVVFSGFSQPALWTLVPALFFGYTLQKTGLGKHVALLIIGLIKKPSYLKVMLAWVLIGVVLSILTPSITVRVAIIMPVAARCCELFDLEKHSKGNSLIQLTAFAMALTPGNGWLSGSLNGPILQGLFDAQPQLNGLLNFSSWFSAVFLPMELTTVLLIIFGWLMLKPKDGMSLSPSDELTQAKHMPWSREEKISGVILCMVFVLFLTNQWHGIPDAAVCLLALFLFFAFGIMDVKEVSVGINWDLIIFIGMSLGLGSVFEVTGLSEWFSGMIVGLLAPVSSNPWLLIYASVVFLFLWRFIDIAILIPTMAVLVPVLPAISQAYAISPLVWVVLFVMSINCFFMAYQNMWALMSQSMNDDRSWTGAHLGRYGLAYFAACLVALAVAVPYWMGLGLV